MALVFAVLLFVILFALAKAEGANNCRHGWVQLNKTFDTNDLFHPTLYPDRAHPAADGYIALDWRDRDLIGKWFLFKFDDDNKWRLVRVADVRQKKHQASHDEKWGDTWCCEVGERIWDDRPVRSHTGTICQTYMPFIERMFEGVLFHTFLKSWP